MKKVLLGILLLSSLCFAAPSKYDVKKEIRDKSTDPGNVIIHHLSDYKLIGERYYFKVDFTTDNIYGQRRRYRKYFVFDRNDRFLGIMDQ